MHPGRFTPPPSARAYMATGAPAARIGYRDEAARFSSRTPVAAHQPVGRRIAGLVE
jgi:hypothetical protein